MNTQSMNILYLIRRLPYSGTRALETLDAILVGAVFEQSISVLFADDGVWQLRQQQNTARAGLKNIAQQLSVMPEYEIESLYVCEASLKARNLSLDALCLPLSPLSYAAQIELIRGAEVVIND
ncbi:MAG: sulfurtransferase complex subunit TusC [Pseudomonadales bacterium]